MKKNILIESIQWYPFADTEMIQQLTQDMMEHDRPILLLFHPQENSLFFTGIVLKKYATVELTGASCIRRRAEEDGVVTFQFSRAALPSFMRYLSKQCVNIPDPIETDLFDFKSTLMDTDPPISSILEEDPLPSKEDPYLTFLKTKTPASIEQELNAHIIGQPQLTKAVADFLYYHALRQQHPALPQRPLLIAGPSGSGKTEVWRAAKKLYADTFHIRIIDGSNISGEGWSGNYKIDTYMDAQITDGGILVVDEFDKLVTPKHSSSGENVSMSIQAEFLKLVEGEYCVSKKKELTSMTSKMMGFVMVGAFEALRRWKQAVQTAPSKVRIGFCAEAASEKPITVPVSTELTDEDFIAFGMMPELVGRIAAKCSTRALDAKAYLGIIRGPHSRVALIEQVLEQYGVRFSDVISDEEILALVATSKHNCTGVRWVSAQVETRLLEAIRQQGLFPSKSMEQCA